MPLGLWGKITGKDERKQQPRQQASFLGRVGDYNLVFPYGLYGDLPANTLLQEIAPGVAIPVTVKRPSDTEQGEPVFFHPATNTRIIARNSGDLDVFSDTAVNVTAPLTTFSGDVQIDGALNVDNDITGLTNIIATALLQGATLTISGNGSIGGKDYLTHTHTQGNDSNGDTEVDTGGVV
jgi:hypothetical protein